MLVMWFGFDLLSGLCPSAIKYFPITDHLRQNANMRTISAFLNYLEVLSHQKSSTKNSGTIT